MRVLENEELKWVFDLIESFKFLLTNEEKTQLQKIRQDNYIDEIK